MLIFTHTHTPMVMISKVKKKKVVSICHEVSQWNANRSVVAVHLQKSNLGWFVLCNSGKEVLLLHNRIRNWMSELLKLAKCLLWWNSITWITVRHLSDNWEDFGQGLVLSHFGATVFRFSFFILTSFRIVAKRKRKRKRKKKKKRIVLQYWKDILKCSSELPSVQYLLLFLWDTITTFHLFWQTNFTFHFQVITS